MLYDYECNYCEYLMDDVQQSINDEPLLNCPNCGEDALKRVITGGAYAFVKGSNSIGGRADKNASENKNKIDEAYCKKTEGKSEQGKAWYHSNGQASTGEIQNMNKKQKAKYIMEGKK